MKNNAPAARNPTAPTPVPANSQKPQWGEFYRHYKGSRYMVLCIAKEEATAKEVVVYQEVNSSQVWTRPLEEFCSPRFEREP